MTDEEWPIPPEGEFDLDDYGQVYDELVATVTSTSEYGLGGPNPADRIRALGRIGFLAGRLTWLEAAELRKAARDE